MATGAYLGWCELAIVIVRHPNVVGGLARTAEVELDAALLGPFVHDLGDEFAAIVDFDNAGQAARGCNGG
ncbi:hypothetical protein SAMN05216316_2643 [Nitrosovibrio sp. Nv6]|nr:hypothetical protein SAMN05216316_2643 [Nitrosovibrio sp. Nv6]